MINKSLPLWCLALPELDGYSWTPWSWRDSDVELGVGVRPSDKTLPRRGSGDVTLNLNSNAPKACQVSSDWPERRSAAVHQQKSELKPNSRDGPILPRCQVSGSTPAQLQLNRGAAFGDNPSSPIFRTLVYNSHHQGRNCDVRASSTEVSIERFQTEAVKAP